MSPMQRHRYALVASTGEALVPGNRLELLIDGPAMCEALLAAVDAATDHIHIESYIVEGDGPGEELAHRLELRARAGVKVNLLFDSFGSFSTPAKFFQRLRAAGVTVCEYHPLKWWRRRRREASWHERDHRKLAIIDGRTGFIGGMNISNVYSASAPGGDTKGDAAKGWRDTHLRVTGPIVARLQQMFLDHWHTQTGQMPAQAHWFPRLPATGSQSAVVAASHAGLRRNPIYRALLRAIERAHTSVHITAAYFVPPRRLHRRLIAAARRGVDVQVIVPAFSDSWLPLAAGRAYYGKLLSNGVRIFEHCCALLHAKTAVVDGVWATVGSCNLDWRSIIHNAEANLIAIDAGFGAALDEVFAKDIGNSVELNAATWRSRSKWLRAQEWLARKFQYLL